MNEFECEKGTVQAEQIHILGMSCMHCAHAVKTALESIDGVKEVSVDLSSGTADVKFICDGSIDGLLREAVQKAGYEVAVK